MCVRVCVRVCERVCMRACMCTHVCIRVPYLPTIPDSPELLRKSASNYGITARGKIITEIVDYGNLVTSGNKKKFTFEEGHTHVCILRGVTRATLIFLLDLLKLL